MISSSGRGLGKVDSILESSMNGSFSDSQKELECEEFSDSFDQQEDICSPDGLELQNTAEKVHHKHTVAFMDPQDDIDPRHTDTTFINGFIADDNRSNSSGTFEKLRRLKSRLKLEDLSQNELELKASLYFHICNPLKRWKVEKLVPYKLVLQIVKTLLLVMQVVLFTYITANERAVYIFQSSFLFQELFIRANLPDDARPSNPFVARTQDQVLTEITFAIERYYNLPNLTIGSYGYVFNDSTMATPLPVQAELTQLKIAELDASTGQYMVDFTQQTSQFSLESENISGVSVMDQLVANGMDVTFSQHVHLQLQLYIRSIRLSNLNVISGISPECFLFDIKISYSSSKQYGGVEYSLDSDALRVDCNGQILSKSGSYDTFVISLTVLDLVIIMLCMVSISFTFHTYQRAYKLGKAMGDFYLLKLNIRLSWWERRSLFSIWSVFTFFSDVMLITGSLLKILLQFNVLLDAVPVRILIGTALIVQAGALMRYFSFFKQLNALTRTLSAAYPELLKFLLCTSLLYFAFALCGLVVFGSYGTLFSNFGNSVEILFALINGDSIWMVFRAFDSHDIAVYVYSRFFVYVFIFLFIYAVLNLFTSLVKTSYDESTNIDRATINEVRRFIFSGPLTPNGVALRDVTHVQKYVDPKIILCRRKRRLKKQSISDLD